MSNFTVHKRICGVSSITIDLVHEQNNKTMKSDGGAVGRAKILRLSGIG